MTRIAILSLFVLLAAACRSAAPVAAGERAAAEREAASSARATVDRALATARLREHAGALELGVAVGADGEPRPWREGSDGAARELALDALPRGALPVGVRLVGEHVVCTRRDAGPSIVYLVLERRGVRRGYGVYGLGGPKNGLPVPRPLAPATIAWDDRDDVAAVRYLLERAGLAPGAAAALVAERGGEWFAEGLRVLFFLRPAAARGALPRDVATDGRPLVVRVEVDSER